MCMCQSQMLLLAHSLCAGIEMGTEGCKVGEREREGRMQRGDRGIRG